jgi:hypothetical protein
LIASKNIELSSHQLKKGSSKKSSNIGKKPLNILTKPLVRCIQSKSSTRKALAKKNVRNPSLSQKVAPTQNSINSQITISHYSSKPKPIKNHQSIQSLRSSKSGRTDQPLSSQKYTPQKL